LRRSLLITSLLGLTACGPSGPVAGEFWTEPETGMEFVRIEAGSFAMGTPADEPMREAQEVLHTVTLTEPLWLGRAEVTQGEWERVMGENPSRFVDCGPRCPVETVSYVEIEAFVAALAELTGERFRLPTEAEWEYACRAGSTSAFGVGERIGSDVANFDGSDPYPGAEPGPYLERPTPVGSYPPNAWSLYDMNGNVWEWTEDDHCPYPEGPVVDPLARCDSGLRVIRGGSWYFGPDSARCGLRYTHRPVDDGPSLGFRLVRVP
jgi:formylglycine-generating enzyme required for sulfatase activity